jgi:hypothetical protein
MNFSNDVDRKKVMKRSGLYFSQNCLFEDPHRFWFIKEVPYVGYCVTTKRLCNHI